MFFLVGLYTSIYNFVEILYIYALECLKLGYLPPQQSKWESVLNRDRTQYRQFLEELFLPMNQQEAVRNNANTLHHLKTKLEQTGRETLVSNFVNAH